MSSVLCLILGGGRGSRLYPLTKSRSKPAVPVAGKYRLIDIPISNCINSEMNRIYVLTQFLSVSLHKHINAAYQFDAFGKGFVEVLAAQQTNEAADWYQGTADAVRQNIRYIIDDPCEHVLILSGDQLYRMDFRKLLKTHKDSNADATIAVLPVTRDVVDQFGLVNINSEGRIDGFIEKPKTEEEQKLFYIPSDWIEQQGIPAKGRNFIANMGIYMFKKQVLIEMLSAKPLPTDFGKELFPRAIRTHRIMSHLFDGYWEDLGTVKAYHEAGLALAGSNPPFDFHSPEGIIYTRMRFLPASRIENSTVIESLISDGCVVQGGTRVERSLIGVRSRIGRNTIIRDTIVIGADRFETDAERARNAERGIPNLNIADDCVIERAILDKDCRIGKGVRITNEKKIQEAEGSCYVIRDGVVVIPRGTIVPAGTVI